MNRRVLQVALWSLAYLAFAITLIWADDTDDDQAHKALWLTDHAKLEHKVKTLVIGDVDLKDVTIDQAIDFLRHQSKLLDPDHQGINFVYLPSTGTKSLRFSVNLKNATVENVLNHFPTGFFIGDRVVELPVDHGDGITFQKFKIPDNFLAINTSMLVDKEKQIYDVRSLLIQKGIRFSQSDRARYILPSKTLVVVGLDDDQLIHIDELLVFGSIISE